MNAAERPTLTLDQPILAMWRNGLDTYEIAQRLHLKEHVVARRLWAIRESLPA